MSWSALRKPYIWHLSVIIKTVCLNCSNISANDVSEHIKERAVDDNFRLVLSLSSMSNAIFRDSTKSKLSGKSKPLPN